MPLITIESEAPSEAAAISRMIHEVRETGAVAYGCPPSNIWVVFRAIPDGWSVRDGAAPVVIIRAKAGPLRETRERLVASIKQAVARGLKVAQERVWVHYQEMHPEDVFF